MAEENTHPIKYMSFGSPLMDCIADVPKEFIERNEIELDSTIHKKLSEIKFLNEFLTEYDVTYIPGGCQFNAMRVFNWILEKDKTDTVAFLGSVGKIDRFGTKYKELLEKENIIPIFEDIENQNTGLCLVVCCDRDRAHLTDLGASVSITERFVNGVWEKFKEVELIYTELFILKTQREICFKLAKLGLRDETTYGFNLPSDYFLKTFQEDIAELCQYADIIFANKSEASYFCKLLELEVVNYEDTEELAYQLCKNIKKKNKNKKRIVVVTNGPNPASCCQYDHIENKTLFKNSYNVKDVPKIVDTNGAGDSFAGGFLSQFVKGKDLEMCMKVGHWAASVIIQKRGCQIPNDISFNENDID